MTPGHDPPFLVHLRSVGRMQHAADELFRGPGIQLGICIQRDDIAYALGNPGNGSIFFLCFAQQQ